MRFGKYIGGKNMKLLKNPMRALPFSKTNTKRKRSPKKQTSTFETYKHERHLIHARPNMLLTWTTISKYSPRSSIRKSHQKNETTKNPRRALLRSKTSTKFCCTKRLPKKQNNTFETYKRQHRPVDAESSRRKKQKVGKHRPERPPKR